MIAWCGACERWTNHTTAAHVVTLVKEIVDEALARGDFSGGWRALDAVEAQAKEFFAPALGEPEERWLREQLARL